RDIKRCPALQLPGPIQPLPDACDQKPDDLAFSLHSRSIIVWVNPQDFQGRRDAIVELRTRDGNIASAEHMQIDDEG
ncbi:MAG: hypothetical protein NZ520_02020, partial [bacterium]|nr:hypothetical protein [bacterium]